ncbi:MAG: hypothetical protein HOJ15_02040 [Candidatus Jacksonbacteria bacterium]|nr:hypothetical protein [Candidatus Jacksonbacteria bacterium]
MASSDDYIAKILQAEKDAETTINSGSVEAENIIARAHLEAQKTLEKAKHISKEEMETILKAAKEQIKKVQEQELKDKDTALGTVGHINSKKIAEKADFVAEKLKKSILS